MDSVGTRAGQTIAGWRIREIEMGQMANRWVSVRRIAWTAVMVGGVALCVVSTLSSGVFASMQEGSAQTPAAPKDHPAAGAATTLPDGPGKDELMRVCSKCHSPTQVMANRQDRQGWEDTITKMVGLGAEGTDVEFTNILEYLVKNFPREAGAKTNVNKATAAEMAVALELSAKEAEAIVDFRTKNGDFKSIDDLKKVPQVDPKKLDAKKDQLAYS